MPEQVDSKNLEYAKHCLSVAKKTLLCGHTMKTKPIEHEQYCKRFVPKSEEMLRFDSRTALSEISRLEDMIKKCESTLD